MRLHVIDGINDYRRLEREESIQRQAPSQVSSRSPSIEVGNAVGGQSLLFTVAGNL